VISRIYLMISGIYLVTYSGIVIGLLLSGAAAVETAPRAARQQPIARDQLCGSADEASADLARRLTPLGEAGRVALIKLAQSSDTPDRLCGIAGLTALADRRVLSHLVAALRDPGLREQAYQLARWAAYMAGGPDTDLGPVMLEVIEAISDQAVWDAAGVDAIWLLGEVDHPAARERLLTELRLPLNGAKLDAVIHGLARQGDPRALAAITQLGVEAGQAKSGNATPEQASRLGEVAFYQLALGPDSLADGLATLQSIARRDQDWTAAWAVHTLCARAVRRPRQRDEIGEHRAALVEQLNRLGVSWQEPKGTFGCPRP
jgi:hypothetical protein